VRYIQRKWLSVLMLVAIITYGGYGFRCNKQQEVTGVTSTLVSLGNIKRDLRARGEITPQQSADITRKLDAMNRSYRHFITDEQKRLSEGRPDPSARMAALTELRSLLVGISDPSILGIKNANSQTLWRESIGTLNTILAGFGG